MKDINGNWAAVSYEDTSYIEISIMGNEVTMYYGGFGMLSPRNYVIERDSLIFYGVNKLTKEVRRYDSAKNFRFEYLDNNLFTLNADTFERIVTDGVTLDKLSASVTLIMFEEDYIERQADFLVKKGMLRTIH